jgi:small-conductance mechanosensitive channel
VQLKGVFVRFALASVLVISSALTPLARAAAPTAPQPRPADAQSSGLTAAPSADELQALTRTLEDPAARGRLIGELRALAAASRAEPGAAAPATPRKAPQEIGVALLALISGQINRISTDVAAMAGLARSFALADWARRLATDPLLQLRWGQSLAVIFAAVGLALLAERVCKALTRRVRRRPPAERPVWRVVAFAREIALRWAPPAAFASAGYATLAAVVTFWTVEPAARAAAVAILNAHVLAGAVIGAAGAALTPSVAGVAGRAEETASYWQVWIGRLTRLAVYGYFAFTFALDVGVDPALVRLLARVGGLAIVSLLVMLILQNRAAVARALRGGEMSDRQRILPRIRRRVAEIWHWVAIVYLLAAYGLWASGAPEVFGFMIRASAISALVVVIAGLATIAGVDLVGTLLKIGSDLAQRIPSLQDRVNRYALVLTGALQAAIGLVGLALILQAWGVDPIGWLSTAIGRRLLEEIVVIGLSIAIAAAVWEAAGLFIDVYLTRPGVDGTPVERSARLRTLLPLARRTLAIVLGGVVFLVFLSEIGLNIGPLLAGAGIAGITIGFGAQSLVKDVINGIFILAQDAVAVGDVVTVADCSGLVEDLSIRSIRLRALDGTVILVPFSEIRTVRNLTKEFSYALFDIGVSYREDVDEVVRIVTKLADELRTDPEYAWRILEPIEVLGLDQFADSAVIIKARIKTRPIQQWTVLREFNRRLKRRFDELGVEIPFPHRTLYFGVDRRGEAPPARVFAEFAGAAPPSK